MILAAAVTGCGPSASSDRATAMESAAAGDDVDVANHLVVHDPEGTGPWPALTEFDATLRTHTLYRPARLPDKALPLVVWGNGGCSDDGLRYGAFLREIASHGFVLVALGTPQSEPVNGAGAAGDTGKGASPSARGQSRRDDATQASQMIDAIDWAIAQNSMHGGRMHGRINTQRIGVMGHSCGGLQAIRVSSDPRISTTMIFNSGAYNAGPSAGRSGIRVTKDELSKLHAPVAYISGGPSDVAHENAADDVARIEHVPVFFAYDDAGHSGTFWSAENGGEYARIAVAWLSWQLKDDPEAGRMFAGTDCRLCVDPAWAVERKQIR